MLAAIVLIPLLLVYVLVKAAFDTTTDIKKNGYGISKCPNCGTTVPGTVVHNYCANCGTKLVRI